MQNRATTGGHSVNQHHRRAHPHPGHLGFKGALIGAVEMRHIGGGSAHVKADDLAKSGAFCRLRHGHHAARRAGENRILALKQIGCGQPARRHHKHQPRAGMLHVQLTRHLRHIARQNGGEISIHHRGVAAPHQLDER